MEAFSAVHNIGEAYTCLFFALLGLLPQVLVHVRFMLQTGGLTDTESQTETQVMAQTGSVISKGIYNDEAAVVTVLLPSFSYS